MNTGQFNEIQINPLLQQLRTNPVMTPSYGFFKNSEGLHIFYRSFVPSTREIQKIIIICHGMGGDGEYFILFADQVVEQTGSAVFAVDYRGHGHSEGTKGDIKDFQSFIDDLKEFVDFIKLKYQNIPLFIMGESMGGIVSVNFAAQYPDLYTALIEFAPAVKFNIGAVSIKDVFKAVGAFFIYLFKPGKCLINAKGNEEIGLKNIIHQEYDRTNPYHLDKVSLRYILQLNKFSKRAYHSGEEIRKPVIIFQGEDDRAVNVEGVKTFFNSLKSEDKELVLIPEGYHALFTDSAAVGLWDKIRDWLETH